MRGWWCASHSKELQSCAVLACIEFWLPVWPVHVHVLDGFVQGGSDTEGTATSMAAMLEDAGQGHKRELRPHKNVISNFSRTRHKRAQQQDIAGPPASPPLLCHFPVEPLHLAIPQPRRTVHQCTLAEQTQHEPPAQRPACPAAIWWHIWQPTHLQGAPRAPANPAAACTGTHPPDAAADVHADAFLRRHPMH